MTVTEFRAIYPRFQCRDDLEIANYLVLAETYCPQRVWLNRQSFGIQLLTAHFLECSWQQDLITAGMATAIGQGGSVQIAGNFEDSLTQTTFGREFKMLWGIIPVAPIFV